MKLLKVNYGYFWIGFNKTDNYFTRLLSRKYRIELSDNPDLFFFTHNFNGRRGYLKYKCHRIFIGWENERADWSCCDYVLDSDFYLNNPRHKRWPIWVSYETKKLIAPKDSEHFLNKKKFACIVVSNPYAKERIEFYNRLSKYKQVDSGGKHLNNIGAPVVNKLDFISDYKFVISFENSSYPGYTTEKLIEPMLVNSIPIYWGNPKVGLDFNTRSFIHVNSFTTYDEAIDYIIDLDNDDERFLQMAAEPWFKNNRIPDEFCEQSFLDFFDFVISDSKHKKPVANSFMLSQTHKAKLLLKKAKTIFYNRIGIHRGFR
jgi:alpha(1,3/1,4) fucosyltransferase